MNEQSSIEIESERERKNIPNEIRTRRDSFFSFCSFLVTFQKYIKTE